MPTISLDVETTKAPKHQPWIKGALLVAVGIVDEAGRKRTWLFNHDDIPSDNPPQKQMIREIQEEINNASRIVGANIKFDLSWLRALGISFDHCEIWCTQVTEYLLRGCLTGDLSLAALSTKYGIAAKKDLVKSYWDAGYETTEIPLGVLLPYLEQDCYNALSIFQHQVPQVMALGQWNLHVIEMEAIKVLSELETNGLKFNKELAEQTAEAMRQRLAVIDALIKVNFTWDVNLDSTIELSAALFGGVVKRDGKEWVSRELKYETKYYERNCVVETKVAGLFTPMKDARLKSREGYYSTDKSVINRLGTRGKKNLKELKVLLIERSQVTKTLETLVGQQEGSGLIAKVQEDGCIHGKYNQSVTKTGRLSSSDPNQQNLPREGKSVIKQCIVPRHDWIADADASQIEWRAAAVLSQDRIMLIEINGGIDPHRENAILLFGVSPDDPNFTEIRNLAKIITFRLLYGSTAKGFYYDADMPRKTEKEWQLIIDKFYEKYQGLKAWQDRNMAQVLERNGVLLSVTGRYFHISQDKKGFKRRNVCNYPVQAFATADIMKLVMVMAYRYMKKANFKSLLIGQVHDSLVFDAVEEELPLLSGMMKRIFKSLPSKLGGLFNIVVNVPLTGDFKIGRNYGEMKKWDGGK